MKSVALLLDQDEEDYENTDVFLVNLFIMRNRKKISVSKIKNIVFGISNALE